MAANCADCDSDDSDDSFKWGRNRVGSVSSHESQDSVVVDVEEGAVAKDVKKLHSKKDGDGGCTEEDWRKFEQFLDMLPSQVAQMLRGMALKARENGWVNKKG